MLSLYHTQRRKSLADWRSDLPPTFAYRDIEVSLPAEVRNYDSADVRMAIRLCIEEYQRANQMMEWSISEAALSYVRSSRGDVGPILAFANTLSSRYLDLMNAYVAYEAHKKLPLIPVTAGLMKQHGFTTEEILEMVPSCKELMAQMRELAKEIPNKEQFEVFMSILANKSILDKFNIGDIDGIVQYLENSKDDNELKAFLGAPGPERTAMIAQLRTWFDNTKIKVIAKDFVRLESYELVNKAMFLMHDFAHMYYRDIVEQLDAVANIDMDIIEKNPSHDERLLMEIRHRVTGDSTKPQDSFGAMGSNPLSYLRLIREEHLEGENWQAEFREKMYFAYMLNHFANAVIKDQPTIDYVNQWLKDNKKGWQMDEDFIAVMKQRGPQYLPPIFRYGSNAALNSELRHARSHEEVKKFKDAHPTPRLGDMIAGKTNAKSWYHTTLSSRELLNQTGKSSLDPNDQFADKPVNYHSGASVFDLTKQIDSPTTEKQRYAKAYLDVVNRLGLPVVAGPSGTLDQSTTMAGLVGMGIETDLMARKSTLEDIRLAYLAFMLIGKDHTYHEIMQSSKSFGLEYCAGPGTEACVYPKDPAFVDRVAAAQKARGMELPSYYLSDKNVLDHLTQMKAKPQNDRLSTRERNSSRPEPSINTLIVGRR